MWAKQFAKKRTLEKNERKSLVPDNININISFNNNIRNIKNDTKSFVAGYLPLKKIYYDLKLDKICKHIKSNNKFDYDLNDILEKLVY